MSPSTDTVSDLTTSTETTTISIASLTSYYVTQTYFATIIKALMDYFNKEVNNIRLVTAQDVHFSNTRSHLSALQSCELIFSTNYQFVFTFK